VFKEPLNYRTREEQGQLLQQVLAASDMDADEERMPGDNGPRAGSSVSCINSNLRAMSFVLNKDLSFLIIFLISNIYINIFKALFIT